MDDSNVSYTAVSSSNVSAVGYDTAFKRLWVKFKSGDVYAYESVPSHVYLDMLRAASVGSYLWRVVRANGTDSLYAYAKVR
ncbi:hypothetical protein GobsT_31320 [Gemmata obscuriglobus]|uniref:KTSC domain-containing protein n=1 Tax=Gemmata obscuriglobus TaxID=114 RepID=A0A2Z3GW73_9BACT|nr:KTSC domain-containing protein [Gemmata obscuriglobus]AWM38679.1 KTSC domain-containing protein [Gemmata obscuriglobus]QEG28355.1 hypothetical protein GobsT_31320 [Gemmata obscuriglobus]VTS06247.1 Uncharacterized protein OS=Dehalobacter sp. DCA GN=DHBDCA_p892 PE=4 SV=1: KTSC [Gemmata obscuriglobus UQM 2246]VTS08149.1 Uncharacterized protein OS=Dehalobacter sp. DCA GN=DHBDCA_p892 PE=4 SV=1: KTSC [Gemmata obscuriglobus UQM 2246]